ncbi:Protein of unknown function DUF424 [Methanoregula boonei 6A8]|jgi:hypothetical protein|uniref:DUF424 domain-containing protein n=1 Tax=Methanoregula boonei (strain DSM 21154 / JCM 14090 / 6A8) TaxID=456442 RepID=A7I8X6_METB6|nr:DUF424 domain-containing protein [Methanoregula boonei]ABS56187.1 Protein of unknown function DUF424 [Methanoregula boonei 6A8]
MFLKIHHSPEMGDVVAVCDRELLNTTITHGDLRVTVTEGFYGTTHADEAAVTEALLRGDNVNLMGERAVGVAVKMGLITRADCIMIGSVPHAQIYRL